MARTIAEVIFQARLLLQDTRAESYRYSDAHLMHYFNSAMADARRLRADLFLDTETAGSTWESAPTFSVGQINSTFPIDDGYFSAVAEYIVGLCNMEDDEFVVDGRAVALLNRFAQRLVGRGA